MNIAHSSTVIIANAAKLAKSAGNQMIDATQLFVALASIDSPVSEIMEKHGLDFESLCSDFRLDASVVSDDCSPTEFSAAVRNFRLEPRRLLNESQSVAEKFGSPRSVVMPVHILLACAVKSQIVKTILTNKGVEAQDFLNDIAAEMKKVANNKNMVDEMGDGETEDNMDADEIPMNNPRQRRPASAGRRERSKYKNLDKFGKNLTQLAAEGKIDPIVGREEEINRIMQILARRTKNNPCLVGDPGVGKTAIAEGLALKISQNEVPDLLLNKVVYSIDINSMVAGAKYRGDFEERMQNVIKEASENPEVILFIDEIHMIVGAGEGDNGKMDAANIMKPMLARNELQLIGATTLDEYSKCIEKDAALERRFQKVIVDEPSTGEAILILKGLRSRYEEHHKIHITDEAIEQAVMLSNRYITDRFLPDKAVDLIDEAAARMRINFVDSDEKRQLEKKLKAAGEDKQKAIDEMAFEKAETLREEEEKIKARLEEISLKVAPDEDGYTGTLTSDHIAGVLASWTGIPVAKLTETDTDKLKNLEEELMRRVIGQDEAVHAIARAVRRSRLGLKDPSKPSGSFIFMGTTGVGKTELAKALADVMFGGEKNLIRIDMSEYMEKNDVSKLIGAPPGYVGYEEAGQLTEAVRRQPYSVVLFDEIEKAHPDIFNVMLQVLDDGRLTDGKGRVVDFKNTIVIMTSNVGARMLTAEAGRRIGFDMMDSDDKDEASRDRLYGGKTYDDAKTVVMDELKKSFTPEFINRVDEVIFFRMLSRDSMLKIVDIMLGSVAKLVKNQGITFETTAAAKEYLAKEGYDPQYGARPMRRVIQSKVEDTFSEAMLDGIVVPGCAALVDYDEAEGKIVITRVDDSKMNVVVDNPEVKE